jgi:hypothetical protein
MFMKLVLWYNNNRVRGRDDEKTTPFKGRGFFIGGTL